ncbi:flagellar biosynthesis protein FlhF [Chitinibacter sp. S2-10]|uniref:flagellar biosynthesis protein FlhF n=1 Tax=Chitinibacter sp. S2-10 TaxID=3373597 RepID=UPI003977DE30
MVVKKYFGATTREALRQVRDELGPDALILSNRQVAGGGIEIMAVADADVAALTQVQTSAASVKSTSRPPAARPNKPLTGDSPTPNLAKALARSYSLDDDEVTLSQSAPPQATPAVVRSNRQPRAIETRYDYEKDHESPPAPVRSTTAERADSKAAPRVGKSNRRARNPEIDNDEFPVFSFDDEEAPPKKPAPQPAVENEAVQDIVREIRMLRGIVESQMAGIAWSELSKQAPEKIELLRQLLGAGFCAALSRQLIDKMPNGMNAETGMKWVKAALAHNLPTSANHDDLLMRGGVYALIGPTGVGKTTTVAKLAARAALAYGPQSVALLTTDSYRIGAHDQLRIYGRILGVPVYDVKDETDLQLTLGELSDRRLILIDTVGMGQRDQRIGEQLAMLGNDNVGTILLLAANAQAGTLDDVARRYRNHHLLGCILTKLDETVSIGGSLDVAIRHKLPLQFVTNGQRVPEDLHRANLAYLIDRAFKSPQDYGVFQLDSDEYPLYMSTQDTPNDFSLSLGGARA